MNGLQSRTRKINGACRHRVCKPVDEKDFSSSIDEGDFWDTAVVGSPRIKKDVTVEKRERVEGTPIIKKGP